MTHLLLAAITQLAVGMQLVKLPNESYVERGAFCLDGSGPAFYYRAANATAEPAGERHHGLAP